MSLPGKHKNIASVVLTAVGVAGIAFVFMKYRKSIIQNIRIPFLRKNPLRNQQIEVITTQQQCEKAILKINRACSKYRVLGFDCEWVTQGSTRKPIALLQLATSDGYCALIRLCKMQQIPLELKNLLEDISVLKVGVAPADDARYLRNDYSIDVKGDLDLRHLAALAEEKPEGLSSMALQQLGVKMDKNWRIRCSNWDADELNQKQLLYAATDALVAIEIFRVFTEKIIRNRNGGNDWKTIWDLCSDFINVKFKGKRSEEAISKKEAKRAASMPFEKLISDEQKKSLNQPNFKAPSRNYSCPARTKPLYQNCYMQTNDGEVLCTCDMKKAKWYIKKQIADLVCMEPYTIRLRFEPAGRSVGDVGRYYQKPRQNRCVVCGREDSYIRKNIVPREYRKLFPAVMKDHSSHDVLLLCSTCHQLSNTRDQLLRSRLAHICDAPVDNRCAPKLVKDPQTQKVRSAARALMMSSTKHNIPEDRKEHLVKEVLDYFPDATVLTDDLLLTSCKLDSSAVNPLFEPHGQLVVDHFTGSPGGLLGLERLWREHFLKTMQPQYMPDLWSVDHNKARLEIRAIEGRVDHKDLMLAGLAKENDFAEDSLSPEF